MITRYRINVADVARKFFESLEDDGNGRRILYVVDDEHSEPRCRRVGLDDIRPEVGMTWDRGGHRFTIVAVDLLDGTVEIEQT